MPGGQLSNAYRYQEASSYLGGQADDVGRFLQGYSGNPGFRIKKP